MDSRTGSAILFMRNKRKAEDSNSEHPFFFPKEPITYMYNERALKRSMLDKKIDAA